MNQAFCRATLLAVITGAATFVGTAQAAPWSQAYAVEWFEPAFYFGAKDTNAADAPGTDCPKGINPELDNKKLLLAAGYPPDQIDAVLDPDNQTGVRRKWLAERGPSKQNIYMGDSRIGGQLKLMQARLKLQVAKDGTLSGLLGGYVAWEQLHRENNDYIREVTGHMSAAGLWYALQRHADGIRDPKTGKNTALSIAYTLDAIPAFLISPEGTARVVEARTFEPDEAKLAAIKEEEARLRARQQQRLNVTPRRAE